MKSETQSKFELGPIQKEWLRRLRAHPERQMKEVLGVITDLESGSYTCCCLGQGLLTLCELNNTSPSILPTGNLSDNDIYGLETSFSALGLLNSVGEFKLTVMDDYESLAEMNDRGVTWPEIADYIEANPENVFTKSV